MAEKVRPARFTACALLLCATLLLPTRVAGGDALPPATNAEAGQDTLPKQALEQPAGEAATAQKEDGSIWLTVPLVLQEPELPNGCEVTSLSMLLAFYGYNVSKTDLADHYLTTQTRYNDGRMDWGGDPEEVFPGDPEDDTGWYCYAKPLANAANRYLSAVGGGHTAEDITGVSVEALEELLRGGTPVAVWMTTDGAAPRFSRTAAWRLESGKWLRPYTNVHCAVLCGYSEGSFLFNDPLGNFAEMDKKDFTKIYTQLGSRAMVLAAAE